MIALDELVAYLDLELDIAAIPDYPGAVNGLQLASDVPVPRIVAAVDASLPVIREAAAAGPGLLIVHHGMFWQGLQTVTGPFYRKLRLAMDAGLAIYSSHLPLDIHPEWGNNILLAKALGVQNPVPFFLQKGNHLGIRGDWQGTRSALADALSNAVGCPIHHCPGGPPSISHIGIVTGGAGSEIARISAEGIDTFITGEGPHWSYPLAEELAVNLFYGGHYATETFGVKALAAAISTRFDIPWSFIDHPTGL